MIAIPFPEHPTATIIQRVAEDSFEVAPSYLNAAGELREFCRYPNSHYGSSTGVEDTRKIADYTVEPALRDTILEIQYRLGMNKSQLADIFRVSRPTLYEWLEGGQPQVENQARIEDVVALMRALPPGARLNARFVRKSTHDGRTLVDFLGEEHLNKSAIRKLFEQILSVGDAEKSASQAREVLRRKQGFEDVSSAQQDTNLKTNVAKLEWPR